MDHTLALPDDLLADILRHLPPRDLAASRCVRKAWLAVVDAHRLLLPHVLPHSVCGLFVNYVDHRRPHLFARPTAHPAITGNRTFLPRHSSGYDTIVDHCNGLLLCDGYRSSLCVVNPATRRWEDLPWEKDNANPYLVFDPAASPRYEVFSIPRVPKKVALNSSTPQRPTMSSNLGELSAPHGLVKLFSLQNNESAGEAIEEDHSKDGSTQSSSKLYKQKSDFSTISESPPSESRDEQEDPNDLMEWPPSSWTLNVFSSSTRQWQMRSFVREGEAAGTMANARLDTVEPAPECWGKYGGPRRRCSAYWQGSLYVHCRGAFFVRLSLSDCKYQVIEALMDTEKTEHSQFLGKSEKGVCLATLHDSFQLRVWNLSESSRHIHWVLKHHIDLEPWRMVGFCGLQDFEKTWSIAENDNVHYNYNYYYYDDDDNEEEEEDEDEDEDEEEGVDVDADVNVEVEVEEEEHEEDDKTLQKENNEMAVSEDREWNSDDDNVLNIEDLDTNYGPITFLGFHPYKEVVFLGLTSMVGVAYHLKSSKVQYLGEMRPKDYYHSPTNGIHESFLYTPCMIGELLKHASEGPRRYQYFFATL